MNSEGCRLTRYRAHQKRRAISLDLLEGLNLHAQQLARLMAAAQSTLDDEEAICKEQRTHDGPSLEELRETVAAVRGGKAW